MKPPSTGAPSGAFDYDAELHRYNAHLRAAADVGAADHVLDIGCGTGQTTREAARAAARGSALGIDIAASMLTHARRLSDEEGLSNITFVQADAQTHRFPQAHFDLAISRFGTMFFADQSVAFSNIRRALRPGARLVQLVWQNEDRQEWSTVIREAFADEQPPTSAAAAFSLADPVVVKVTMMEGGFTDVEVAGIHESVFYGPDAASAMQAALRLQMTRDLMAPLDTARTERTLDRMRAAFAAHETRGGVFFGSNAWLVTARCG